MEYVVTINHSSKDKALKYGLKYDRTTKKWVLPANNKFKHLFVPVEVFVEPQKQTEAKADGVYYIKQLKKYFCLSFQKDLIAKYTLELSEDEDDPDFSYFG